MGRALLGIAATAMATLLACGEGTPAPGEASAATTGGGEGGSIGGCPAGQVPCGDGCVETTSDAAHCGGCGQACVGEHAALACEAGACVVTTCDDGYADCDGAPDTGCEAKTGTSAEHCGACGTVCAAACVDSSCRDAVQVSAGYRHTCVVLEGGSVWCWGENGEGQLGNGRFTHSKRPVPVTSLPTPALSVSAGGFEGPGLTARSHTCALLQGGAVYCWGAGTFGQLGDGAAENSNVPVLVSALQNATSVSAGGMHTCATRTGIAGDDLYCWGRNDHGQLGVGDTVSYVVPTHAGKAGSVDAGWQHTCAVAADGEVWCAGASTSLATGSDHLALSPIGHTALEVASGGHHTCARRASEVHCWGLDVAGQIGDGMENEMEGLPKLVGPFATSVIAAGGLRSAMIVGGELQMWGDNAEGGLGNGDPEGTAVPIGIPLPPAQAVALGDQHTCAIVAGAVWCWGSNDGGQLGTGDKELTLTPVPVVWP